MSDTTRRHPDLILVKLRENAGYGFTYLSVADFNRAADRFLKPGVKSAGLDLNNDEQRRTFAYDYLWRVFFEPDQQVFVRDTVRWIAAAAAREKFTDEMPRVISVERKTDGGIVIRDAKEYLSHPGFPLAVIVGKPAKGGGSAHFFTSQDEFAKAGQAGLTDDMWMPQIVYRLYEETPSVVLGMPRSSGTGSQMGVECRALAFGMPAKLTERKH
ncbi:MAG: hypothetical protein JNM81_16175 [Rhodospirillaceae bacterium]|nr:hypothetical protein [Rhodospirillaceae bacterium]